MDAILNFAKDYYLIFLIVGGIALLALIGYFYDKYQSKALAVSPSVQDENAEATDSLNEEPKKEEQVVQEQQTPTPEQPVNPSSPIQPPKVEVPVQETSQEEEENFLVIGDESNQ